VLPASNAEAFTLHLAEIAKIVAPGAHAVVLTDGAGYHGAGEVEIPANLTLIKLPPYSPELNPVENVWEYLRKNKLANSVWHTYDEIVEACCKAWRFFADDAGAVTSITTREWAKVKF
jgi:transposase